MSSKSSTRYSGWFVVIEGAAVDFDRAGDIDVGSVRVLSGSRDGVGGRGRLGVEIGDMVGRSGVFEEICGLGSEDFRGGRFGVSVGLICAVRVGSIGRIRDG